MKRFANLKTEYLKWTNIFYFLFKPDRWNSVSNVTKSKDNTILKKDLNLSVDLYIQVLYSKALCSVQQAGIKPMQTINEKSSYLCSYPLLFCGHTTYSYPSFYTA